MGVHILYDGEAPIAADVVFVHGLRGHPLDTWTRDGVCWPRDILKDELRNARIISWGYDSAVANLRQSSSQNSIFGHSENLLSDLARIRQDAAQSARPVIFVGHSLGGLVIKEAMIRSSEYLNSGQDLRLGSIYERVAGVVFFGTPHRGSEKTGLAGIVALAAKISFRQPNNALIQALSQDSVILERQRRSFITISRDLPVACLYEELPTAIGMIVPEFSACFDGFRVKTASIRADHMGMCKFDSAEDDGYKRSSWYISQFVADAVIKIQKHVSSCERVILDNLYFPTIQLRYDEIEPCYRKTFDWFLGSTGTSQDTVLTAAGSSIDAGRYKYTVTNYRFTASGITKVEETPANSFYDSIIPTQSTLAEWLRYGDGIYWISGKAGSGKSTLMKLICSDFRTYEHLEIWASGLPLIAANFFFHERGSSMQKSLLGLLQTLLFQILSTCKTLIPDTFPDQWTKLQGFIESQQGSSMVPSLPNFASSDIKGGLKRVCAQGKVPVMICFFIDGLDEHEGNHRDIIELFEEITSNTQPPSRVKLCLSSRPHLVFSTAFKTWPGIRLQDLTYNDILYYVRDKINPARRNTTLNYEDSETLDEIISKIVEKAEGVFLWVTLAVESLLDGFENYDNLDELRIRVEELPPDLEDLYKRAFMKLNAAYKRQAFLYFQLALHAPQRFKHLWFLSFAEEPFEYVLNYPFNYFTIDEINRRATAMEGRLQSRCAGLLEVQKSYRNWFYKRSSQWAENSSMNTELREIRFENGFREGGSGETRIEENPPEERHSEEMASENTGSEDMGFKHVGSEDMGSEDMGSEEMGSEEMDSKDMGSKEMDFEDMGSEEMDFNEADFDESWHFQPLIRDFYQWPSTDPRSKGRNRSPIDHGPTVEFIHQTVKEFIDKPEIWSTLLQEPGSLSYFDYWEFTLASHLCLMKAHVNIDLIDLHSWQHLSADFINDLHQAEYATGKSWNTATETFQQLSIGVVGHNLGCYFGDDRSEWLIEFAIFCDDFRAMAIAGGLNYWLEENIHYFEYGRSTSSYLGLPLLYYAIEGPASLHKVPSPNVIRLLLQLGIDVNKKPDQSPPPGSLFEFYPSTPCIERWLRCSAWHALLVTLGDLSKKELRFKHTCSYPESALTFVEPLPDLGNFDSLAWNYETETGPRILNTLKVVALFISYGADPAVLNYRIFGTNSTVLEDVAGVMPGMGGPKKLMQIIDSMLEPRHLRGGKAI